MKTYNINEVLKLIGEHIFFSKEKYNQEEIYYKLANNKIHCFNTHFSLYLDKNEFLDKFFDTIFYLYEESTEEEEANSKYYRQ